MGLVHLQAKFFGTGVGLWAWELVFAGDPTSLAHDNIFLLQGILYSARKVDLEKTKILQCETTVRDWRTQSEKVEI